MLGPVYNWTRFWCPREGMLNLSDGGFLYDPESEYGATLNPDVKKFEQITATPCLVLLGEPGIGKSHELEGARLAEETAARARGDAVVSLDLRAFQTDVRLCSSLFESAEFKQWKAGPQRLCLFLDSLDECLLRIDTLAVLLADELGRCLVDGLSLRITCRTAEWPHSLEQALKRLWGEGNVGVFELVPLRRRDVRTAAEAEGLDAARFLGAVENGHAVPLAIKPVTLRMLMNLFKKGEAFPAKQAVLYEDGCRLLCEEPNEARREVGPRSALSPDALLAVASRIAAVTVFGNRYAVWNDIDQGNVAPEDVTVRKLVGGAEPVGTQKVDVTEDAVRKARKTGLFSSRGPHRMGWAHQTYAEFLAARYVVGCGMTQGQILSLIVHPDDPSQRLVPQLHETSAWIAGMRAELFQAIMDRDPEVLLRSDVAAAEPEYRQRLVDALLALYAQEKFTESSLDLQGHYSKLSHPGLADQLQPHVSDRNAHWLVRRVAIDIAEACKVEALVPELVRIALDQAEDVQVRKNAAYAVIRAGDATAKAQLKPLALGQAGADPDDNLKGCGLRAVWPAHLTVEELLTALTPKKTPNYTGSYAVFRFDLRDSLPEQLKPEDFPAALEWVARGHDEGHDLEELADWIMTTAWDSLDRTPDLAGPFAKAALARLRNYEPIAQGTKEKPFSEAITRDTTKRRLVLLAVMEFIGSKHDTFTIVHNRTPLATDEDLPWIIEQLLVAPKEKRDVWLSLLNRVFNPDKPGHLDGVLGLVKKESSLASAFPWLQPVDIESPQGRKMKADFLKEKRLEARHEELLHPPALDPPPRERILMLLDQFESGDLHAWWRLNMEMTLKPNSRHYGDELEWDLTALPGWLDADDPTRGRIIAAAKRYVSSPPAIDNSWLGTNTLYRSACGGYRALALLRTVDPAFLDGLPPDAWTVWAPIVIAFPLHSSNLWGERPHTDLVRLAYQRAPDAVLTALGTFWWESERLDHCWDDRIAQVLLEKAKALGIHPDRLESLLYQLLKHEYPPALEYGRSLVPAPPPADIQERARMMVAARTLLAHCPRAAWPAVWAAIQADAGFGRDLLEGLHHLLDDKVLARFRNALSEQQVADLYLWLAGQYPHREDPHYEGAHWVGPRHSIAMFRDGLLSHLKTRGTPQACAQVRRIAAELPDVPWLRLVVLEAEEMTRRKTWQPPKPEHIIALAQDRQCRYVENGEQLLGVLCESIQRLEYRLQARDAAKDLWNTRGECSPKDEADLSDYMKRHLDDDLKGRGIVVNREVQIRRGQLTDIRVDAVSPDHGAGAKVVSAIIEVKGCWHRELETAMQNQLVERYLKDNHVPNGLYLVGWFNSLSWSDSDHRKADAPKCSLDEARKRFAQQAHDLQQAAAVPGLVLRSFVLNAALP